MPRKYMRRSARKPRSLGQMICYQLEAECGAGQNLFKLAQLAGWGAQAEVRPYKPLKIVCRLASEVPQSVKLNLHAPTDTIDPINTSTSYITANAQSTITLYSPRGQDYVSALTSDDTAFVLSSTGKVRISVDMWFICKNLYPLNEQTPTITPP